MEIGVYKILNKKNGKFYVGYSTKLKNRMRAHINMLRRQEHHCIHLQRAWDVDGEDSFEFSVIELCLSKQDAMDREQYLLDQFFSSGVLYNSSPSNDLQIIILKAISNEGKRKSRESRRNSAKFIESSKRNIAKAQTPEVQARRVATAIRNGRLGEKKRMPVICRPLDGSPTKVFKSLADASRALNLSHGNIHMNCIGKRKSVKGFTFSFQLPHLLAFADKGEAEELRKLIHAD
jgi:group I intron endonuclease